MGLCEAEKRIDETWSTSNSRTKKPQIVGDCGALVSPEEPPELSDADPNECPFVNHVFNTHLIGIFHLFGKVRKLGES